MFVGNASEIDAIVTETKEKLVASLLKALLNVRESSNLGEELSFKVNFLSFDGDIHFNDIAASDRVLKHLDNCSFTSYLLRWIRVASSFNLLDNEDIISIKKGEINLSLVYMKTE